MPLSEHEQRLLDQIERALYAEDPKFANTVRATDPRTHQRRRTIRYVIGFVVGVAVLLAGLVAQILPISIVGFLIMFAATVGGVTGWQRAHANRHGAEPTSAPGRKGRAKAPAGPRRSPLRRLEDRWRRRWEERLH